MDPTDPVEDTLQVHSPGAELKEVPAEGSSVPPSPDGAGSPVVVSREDGCDSGEESQKHRPHSEQAGKAGPKERPSLVEETLEPQEMDATPAVTPPSPEAAPETEEKANVTEYRASTPEAYVTPIGLLSTTGSPTWPRTSPKWKQLSSPEGSQIAAGLVSTVKRH